MTEHIGLGDLIRFTWERGREYIVVHDYNLRDDGNYDGDGLSHIRVIAREDEDEGDPQATCIDYLPDEYVEIVKKNYISYDEADQMYDSHRLPDDFDGIVHAYNVIEEEST